MTTKISKNQIEGSAFKNTNVFISQYGTDMTAGNYGVPYGGAGWIFSSSDFPANPLNGQSWIVPGGVLITDNDPTKTNTGQTFDTLDPTTGGLQIAWNEEKNLWDVRDGYSLESSFISPNAAAYIVKSRNTGFDTTFFCMDDKSYTLDHFYLGAFFISESLIAPAANITIDGGSVFYVNSKMDCAKISFISNGNISVYGPDVVTIRADSIVNDSSTTTCGFVSSGATINIYANSINANSSTTTFFKTVSNGNNENNGAINIFCPKIIGKIDASNGGIVNVITSDTSQLTYVGANVKISANLNDIVTDPVIQNVIAANVTTFYTSTINIISSGMAVIYATGSSGSLAAPTPGCKVSILTRSGGNKNIYLAFDTFIIDGTGINKNVILFDGSDQEVVLSYAGTNLWRLYKIVGATLAAII